MNTKSYRIAVLASGNGTNAERVFTHFINHPYIKIALLLSSHAEAPVIKRTEKFDISIQTISKNQLYNTEKGLQLLQEYRITHLVLAGFLWLVPASIVAYYCNRIINIHPSLLPRYGGKGMYGMKVHEAVKRAGDHKTGITIHIVNEHYDEGTILLQEYCDINSTDTPDEIAYKVHQLEYKHYPKTIEKWVLSQPYS